MDDHFLKKRLHSLSRRDELRSKLLIAGVKRKLQENKEKTLINKFFKKKQKKENDDSKRLD